MESDISILGEAKDGEEAIRPRPAAPAGGRPDGSCDAAQGGLDEPSSHQREMPWTKVVMVTVHGEDAYRRAALALGADAFIVKKRLRGELLPLLRRIA